jgi:hypothetical protein
LLEDEGNQCYHRFLDLAAVSPHDKRIRIPVQMKSRLARHLASTDYSWASLIVEITETSVGVRLVASKPAPVLDWSHITAVVGRDFGYTNTISLGHTGRGATAQGRRLAENGH